MLVNVQRAFAASGAPSGCRSRAERNNRMKPGPSSNPSQLLIDGLQYCYWTREVFEQMRRGGVDAVHATVSYHGNFRDAVRDLTCWNRLFEANSDLILPGRRGENVVSAKESGRTAIFLGLQNPSPIEDDIGLVEILHALGIRFMQITYNNQSNLASGYTEANDSGLTRMGREAVREMNRVGMAVDLSHCGERSALEATEASERPVAVTHANPRWWHPSPRNLSDDLMKAVCATGGVLGFSLYPLHMPEGSGCTLASFAEMVARCAETLGAEHLGIGSDLCQGRPDGTLRWMREGRWKKPPVERGGADESLPKTPSWFRNNRDFGNIATALADVGFSSGEVGAIMGGNWKRFFDESFEPRN